MSISESYTTKQALVEAMGLSEEILRNIELDELPLSKIALRVLRLARLLNDTQFQEILTYEVNGYPSTPDGIITPQV